MLEPLMETESFIHKLKCAIGYAGGDSEMIIKQPFEQIIDTCFRNGVILDVKIKER